MRRFLAAVMLAGGSFVAMPQGQPASPAEIAARLENPSQAAYRYRVAIAGLLQLKPGMVVAEVGAVSGYVARAMAAQVGASGRVIASTSDAGMASYITERARAEGLQNLSTVVGGPDGAGLEPASVDAVAMVNSFSAEPRQGALLRSLSTALKPGGALLIVDLPREGQGASQIGIDADDVASLAAAAGFKREAESSVVPGQYALRFRKP